MPLHNDHNVYVLGAGFSRDSGMPLMRDFLHRLRDASAAIGKDRWKECEALERVLEFRLGAAAAAYRTQIDVENIEDLFSLAAAAPLAGEGDTDAINIARAIAATIDHCARQHAAQTIHVVTNEGADDSFVSPASWGAPESGAGFSGPTYKIPVADAYASFISGRASTTPGANTVITFNYDLVLENALRRIGVKFSYGHGVALEQHPDDAFIDQSAPLQVLKLHGSVNWTRSGDDVYAHATYENVWKSSHPPLLLPPTWRKDFTGVFTKVWDAAVQAIASATNVVVIGFSMPSNDVHFKYLLAAGLQSNISLRRFAFVNPDESREVELRKVLRPELFDQGTVKVVPEATRSFFLDGPHMDELGRPKLRRVWFTDR